MAISLKTAGTWARMVTDNGTVSIPGSPASGDRMFLFGAWKTYTITVATPSGWTPIGDEYADGTTAAGNGTGSMKVRAFYRDWVTGDSAPAIDYSTAPTEGFWVINLWQKGAGDTWASPSIVNGAIAAADPFTVNAASTVTVPDGSVVMCLVAFRDDSATMTRATDALDDTGGLVTWNGNHVEAPATHISSTTGQDAAADLGHRLVTTGATGVTLHADGDLSAAESGAALFLIQGLFVSDPKTASPTAASLTLTGGTPAVATPVVAAPTAGSMTMTGATPAVVTTANVLSEPTAGSLALTGATPAVATPVLAQPTAGAIVVNGGDVGDLSIAAHGTGVSLFSISVVARRSDDWTFHRLTIGYDAGVGPLLDLTEADGATEHFETIWTQYLPDQTWEAEWQLRLDVWGDPTDTTLRVAAWRTGQPEGEWYTIPSTWGVPRSDGTSVENATIDSATRLVLEYAPTVTVTDNKTSLPTAASLALTGATPAVAAAQTYEPTPAALALSGATPAVSAAQTYEPTAAALVLTGDTPAVNVGASITAEPTAAALTLTLATPAVAVTNNVTVLPSSAVLALTGATPAVAATEHRLALPMPATLVLRGARPLVVATGSTPPSPSRKRRIASEPELDIALDDDEVVLVWAA